jgi:hypothetical protein
VQTFPKYIVVVIETPLAAYFDSLAAALDYGNEQNDQGHQVRVYEPLGATAAEKVYQEPTYCPTCQCLL